MLAMMLEAPDETGLTLARILADIPHDASAIVVYLMVLGSVLLIWRANRGPRRQR